MRSNGRALQPARWKRVLPRGFAETASNAFEDTASGFCVHEAAGDWPPAVHVILVRLYGIGRCVQVGRPSIICNVECYLYLMKDLWLAVDEVVHHNNVMTRVVVRPGRNVAGR